MRLFLALLGLGLAPTLLAKPYNFPLGQERTLHFRVASEWKLIEEPPPVADQAVRSHILLRPTNSANASLRIVAVSLPDDVLAERANLRRFHEDSTTHYTKGSVESEVRGRDFKTPHGFGVQALFTDANLVGKPPERENYKTVTAVMLHLGERVLIVADFFCDDPQDVEHTEAMEILRSLRVSSERNRV